MVVRTAMSNRGGHALEARRQVWQRSCATSEEKAREAAHRCWSPEKRERLRAPCRKDLVAFAPETEWPLFYNRVKRTLRVQGATISRRGRSSRRRSLQPATRTGHL